MTIYTKTGDRGETGLLGKERFSKGDLIFSILGTIDEANSHLGLAVSFLKEQYLKNKIIQVQRNLFVLGSIFAGAKVSISKGVVKRYEIEIEKWLKIMPERKNFILPGGCPSSSALFVARSVVRRLEREVVAFAEKQKIKPGILVYLNRLSDYLYVLARYLNFQEKIEEVVWKK